MPYSLRSFRKAAAEAFDLCLSQAKNECRAVHQLVLLAQRQFRPLRPVVPVVIEIEIDHAVAGQPTKQFDQPRIGADDPRVRGLAGEPAQRALPAVPEHRPEQALGRPHIARRENPAFAQ